MTDEELHVYRYVFPCYNYTVSGLSTPVFMSIPIVYIWAGAFPALLTVMSVVPCAFSVQAVTMQLQLPSCLHPTTKMTT